MSARTVHNAIIGQLQNDTVIANEFGTNILKGYVRIEDVPLNGRVLRVSFIASDESESEEELSGTRTLASYGFLITIGFYEPDSGTADERKADYDKMIRDAIDKDRSFGGVAIETTEMGRMTFVEPPEAEGYYFGVMPLTVEKYETIGNR